MNAANAESRDRKRQATLPTLSTATASVPSGPGISQDDAILLHTFKNAEACRNFCSRIRAVGIRPSFRFTSGRVQLFVTLDNRTRAFDLLKPSLERDPDTPHRGFRRVNDVYVLEILVVTLGIAIVCINFGWRIALSLLATYAVCRMGLLHVIRSLRWCGTVQLDLGHLFGITTLAAAIISLWIWAL